jgi:nicotinamidase-related amidase
MNAIEPSRSALLVMDFQTDIVGRFGDAIAPVIERAKSVVAAARKAQLPIIYVVVGFRPGYPELNLRNASFAALAKTGRLVVTTPGSDIVPAVRPQEGDVVVLKHRVSAFAGTDMDMILRAKGIDTLILLGLSTSGVVLSTVRHGSDADYQLIVVKDCCADPDEEVHRVLTEKVFVRQATVISTMEATEALQKV